MIPATLALLAFRLSDRRNPAGRFIGLTLAWFLTLALLFAPLIVFHATQTVSEKSLAVWEEVVYLLSPLTPLSIPDPHHGTRVTSFIHVRQVFGDAGVWAVAPLFYAVLFGLLALPVYPSETRRQQQMHRARMPNDETTN